MKNIKTGKITLSSTHNILLDCLKEIENNYNNPNGFLEDSNIKKLIKHEESVISNIAHSIACFSLSNIITNLKKPELMFISTRGDIDIATFILNFVNNINIETYCPIVIFSLKESKTELTIKWISTISEVSMTKIYSGNLSSIDWENITNAAESLFLPIYITDTTPISANDIKECCLEVAKKHKNLGLIIIDNFQEINISNKSSVKQNKETVDILKEITKELNVPIIVSSILADETTIPAFSDLHKTDLVEKYADTIIFIERNDKLYIKREAESDITEINNFGQQAIYIKY